MEWINQAKQDKSTKHQIMSFNDYMNHFDKHAAHECRPTCKYLIDMFNYFGKDRLGRWKIFLSQHPDSPPVFGQHRTQEHIYQNLENFMEEGFNNKFLLLLGPNGSSKSSIIKKIMKGTEEYSKTDEGALYTFSWIFPIDQYIKGTLGLTQERESHHLKSYALLEDKDVSAILPSELKDHPFLLIPKKYRQEIIDKTFKKDEAFYEYIKKTYLYEGDLSKRNKMIYDALLTSYKGDHEEVLKHIRVERFFISKRYSSGAITIEPQLHVDAHMQQITMDRRLATLPPSLQSLNLFSMQGEAILANRGILEYSDLLKRPLDTYKFLLMTMETSNINLQGILTELDIFFVGTSNELHFEAFKQHPDFKSFKGRFNFIKVPYLLNYKEEANIYKDQIHGLKEKAFFEPHALEVLCMFAVMTRLRPPQINSYENKKLGKIVSGLNPLEKVLLFSERTIPAKLDTESKQILEQGLEEVKYEYENDPLYEGKFGISPREIKHIIYKISSKHKNITFIDVLDYLKRFITKKHQYDFLNIPSQGDYHNPHRFIMLLKEYIMNIFDHELRDCLGLVDERSYEDYVKKYILNISALIKGEKVRNDVTGRYEAHNDYLIKEFEKNINLNENPETYRSHLISHLGAYSLDNPKKKIIYTEVFPDLVETLQQTFKEEQTKVIKNISNGLVFYEQEISDKQEDKEKAIQINTDTNQLNAETREKIKIIHNNLVNKYGYSKTGSIEVIKYLITNKY